MHPSVWLTCEALSTAPNSAKRQVKQRFLERKTTNTAPRSPVGNNSSHCTTQVSQAAFWEKPSRSQVMVRLSREKPEPNYQSHVAICHLRTNHMTATVYNPLKHNSGIPKLMHR